MLKIFELYAVFWTVCFKWWIVWYVNYTSNNAVIKNSNNDESVNEYNWLWEFPDCSVVKNPPSSVGAAGDVGSIPGSGRAPGEGNGSPLLENPPDRGA